MNIESEIDKRHITEVLHFTTNAGLTGILALQTVKARKRLNIDQYLEHIYKPNCCDRSRDAAWHDFVNLSVTSINSRLFGISSNTWHRDIEGWWCILSFRAGILAHPGVWFTTTNNMYSGVRRAQGWAGLNAMFAPTITQWLGKTVSRSKGASPCQPTCMQAEVLYPGELSISHLQCVYVRDEEHLDIIEGMAGAMSLPSVACRVSPRHFT
jgi:hypothetical protein